MGWSVGKARWVHWLGKGIDSALFFLLFFNRSRWQLFLCVCVQQIASAALQTNFAAALSSLSLSASPLSNLNWQGTSLDIWPRTFYFVCTSAESIYDGLVWARRREWGCCCRDVRHLLLSKDKSLRTPFINLWKNCHHSVKVYQRRVRQL